MKVIETTATFSLNGQFTIDEPIELKDNSRVRIIILLPDDESSEPYETPTEQVIDGIRQGFYEAFTGQTVPLAQMWEGIDVE
jgi:protein tyrosine phosphatase (PTP) superfamily phosphohydrolase (DUF442 family)